MLYRCQVCSRDRNCVLAVTKLTFAVKKKRRVVLEAMLNYILSISFEQGYWVLMCGFQCLFNLISPHFHLLVIVSTMLQCYVITLLTISLHSTLMNHVDHICGNKRPFHIWSFIRICDLSLVVFVNIKSIISTTEKQK